MILDHDGLDRFADVHAPLLADFEGLDDVIAIPFYLPLKAQRAGEERDADAGDQHHQRDVDHALHQEQSLLASAGGLDSGFHGWLGSATLRDTLPPAC